MVDGLVLWDADFRIRLMNRALIRLYAIPEAMAQPGCSGRDIIRMLALRGDFGPVPRTDAAVAALVEDRVRAMTTPTPPGEPDLRCTCTGDLVEVTRIALADGGTLDTYRLVTRLKARERELQEARAIQEIVLENMTDGVVLWDADFRVVFANSAAERLGEFPHHFTMPGTQVIDVMRFQDLRGDFGPPPQDAAELEARVQARAALLRRKEGVSYIRQSLGGLWVEVKTVALPDGGAVLAYRDVTELKRREAELAAARDAAEAARDAAEAADRAKSTFLAAMSHEIRTPMNGVLGMMEVLEQSPLAPEQERCLAVMRDSAGALLRIIDDILDFSRIEAGRLELEALPLALRGLVQATAGSLRVAARAKGLDLVVDTAAPGPDLVAGDAVRIRQILVNLIGNAVKFTEAGTVRVGIATRALPDAMVEIALSVADSGIGIPAEALARLFQPFAQADSSTTRRYGGSGLGLSIVQRLAGLMGGAVAAESTPGAGSRFTVTLRLPAATCAASAEEPYHLAGMPRGGPSPRLMVAEDHPVNREVLGRMLALLGCEADMAPDGITALAAWRQGGHRIALIDLHMPGMDGLDLARAIRREEAARGLARTALIAVTANAMKGEEERCRAAGMDGFIAKPVAIAALQQALGRFLGAPEQPGEAPAATGDALFAPSDLLRIFRDRPARLAELLGVFATSAAEDGLALGRALAEGRSAAATEHAHRLKGASRTAGAERLGALVDRIEQALQRGDLAAARVAALPLAGVLEATLSAVRGMR